ncbi:hypothetical protein RN001_011178 [Aquatica leii]|uniref:Cytochrome P450 n=1 Tax=Aquatica leii TaxID=1421715 RepID=A0AAN7SEW3_9COLE|nr:hypothetical protein RN001_011178 [Aquatica leii]
MSFLIDFLVVFSTFVVGLYTYYQYAFSYWRKKGVPYPEPSIPFGNWCCKSDEYIGFKIKKRYDEFKTKGHKHVGFYFFTSPSYVPIHPDYVKRILATDYRCFADRGFYYNEKHDPLSAHLFHLENERWKKVRAKLTPSFSSAKIKLMFPSLLGVARQLQTAVDDYFVKRTPIDCKEMFACFTTDVIGSCAFGVDCNSFENPNNDFRRYGKRITGTLTKANTLGSIIALANKSLARFLNVTVTPSEMTKFFVSLVKDTIEYREKNNVTAKDFMQLLIVQKNNDDPSERFTVEEMAAHTFIFFFAGFETSSSTMTFCLYELARHPSLQDKVREEINAILAKHGDVTYDAVSEMKYFDQVIEETLRKYPPLPTIPRICVEDYKVPGTDVTINKGTSVMVPVLGLHYDSEYYPNPHCFDPERFSEESKKTRHSFTYLPFGAGPKSCLGIRFGYTQIKVGLVLLLTQYRFGVNPNTKVPLDIDPGNLFFVAKDEVLLDVVARVN